MRRQLPLLLLAVLTAFSPVLAAAGTPQWTEVRSPHFRVLTDSNEKRGREVALQLERMRSVFQKLLPASSDDGQSPITVLALKNKQDFAAVEPAAYLGKNQLTLAGLFLRTQDRNYILLRLDGDAEHPYATMYHEYAHYTVRKATWLPLWLNEGMAQFYQNSIIYEKTVELGYASDEILYLRQNRLIPLPVLLAVDYTSPYYHQENKGSIFYAESWALTHYLINADWGKPQSRLGVYMQLLRAKTDPALAAQRAFGDLHKLQNDLEMYIANGEYKHFELKTQTAIDPASFQSQPISQTSADAVRADVMVFTDRKPEALALIQSVLQADPKNAQARETMGEIKLSDGDLTAAHKWYGEAVQLNSGSYFAHYYYALTSFESENSDPAQVETSLRTAIRLNPTFAPSYDLLAQVLSRDPAHRAEAHMMNVQAIGLEPDNFGYRLNAASVLINTQQYDSARRVLEEAKRVAKNPQDLERADSELAMVVQRNAAQGTTMTQDGATVTTTSYVQGRQGNSQVMTVTRSDGRTYLLKEGAPQANANSAANPEATANADASASTPATATDTAATGPRQTVQGVIRNVNCVFPSKLTLTVAQPGKPDVTLTTPNFFKLEISAVNYTPQGDMNPCTDLANTKAKVEYTAASGSSSGVIVSIALSH